MEEKYVWVTWQENGHSRYNGQTHRIPYDSLVDPPLELSVGQPVEVYWQTGKKRFWNAVIAPGKPQKRKNIKNESSTKPATSCPDVKTESASAATVSEPPKKKRRRQKKRVQKCKFLSLTPTELRLVTVLI